MDHVFAEVDISVARDDDLSARDRLEPVDVLRDVLTVQPHLHEILTSHVAVTPNTVRLTEAALTCLRDYRIRDKDLVDAYNAWCGYVIGFTTLEAKPPEPTPDPELRGAMRTLLRGTSVADFPIVSELMPEVANRAYGLTWKPERLGEDGMSFEWELAALLDGFEGRKKKLRT